MRARNRGFSVLEILVVMGALVVLTLIGMKGLNVFLEHYVRMQMREEEILAVRKLGVRLQQIIDQRQDHRFSGDPGIDLVGTPYHDGYHLRELRVRTWLGERGTAVWELAWDGGIWHECIYYSVVGIEEPAERKLTYTGRIVLKSANEIPELEGVFRQWTFPDAVTRQAQEGFAIYRFW